MNRPLSIDLETLVGRELTQLPAPRAPHTLIPRVLAAVHAWAERPWYERAWFAWPLRWQLASAAGLILIGMLLPGAWTTAAAAASTFAAPMMSALVDVAGRTAVAMNAASVLWRALFEPVIPYVFGLVMMMCLACAAFGAALNHVVLGRILQR
jgi:hypothetical protein